MTGTVAIRPMLASDWPAVEAIYRAGIDTGNATFETDPPSSEDFERRAASRRTSRRRRRHRGRNRLGRGIPGVQSRGVPRRR